MTLRRSVALLLLLTVGHSSAEVLLGHEEQPPASQSDPLTVEAVLAGPVSDEGSSSTDDCACLCACGCANAQVVVAPPATAFSVTGGESVPAIEIPTGFAKRARARPHLRPPLA